MYLIRNISSREVALGDLRITLKPGQQTDLDKIGPRYMIEKSKALQVAFSKKLIKVVNKDHPYGSKKQRPSKDEPQVTTDDSISREDLKKMEERMLAQLSKHVAQKEDNPVDMSALQGVISQLQNLVQSGSSVAGQNTHNDDIDSSLSEEEMTAIHARAVAKKTQNVSGTIGTSDTKRKSSVADRAKDLEDLL